MPGWIPSEILISKDACWIWLGPTHTQTGYGVSVLNGVRKLAHRAMWEASKGPIQDELCVLHRCDNPVCVNPDHLFLGTRSDNADDRDRKGRTANGENGNNKLKEFQVIEINQLLKNNKTCRELGELYGVHEATISSIKRGKSWKHLNQSKEG